MNIALGQNLTGSVIQSVTPDLEYGYDALSFMGKVSAICRTKAEVADLVRWFGHEDFCPALPVLLCIPGGWGQLAGLGLATAAELRDEGVARWELQEAKLARTGTTFSFDEARERAGLMRREDVDAATRQALRDRIAAHRASPITDPVRQFVYPNPTHKQVFAEQPSNETWKKEVTADG